MRVLHKKLHLQHHQHTGKLLHHRHTSYRGLAVVLVLAGLFMAGLTLAARATADSLIHVYASKPAPIPTDAPVITDPLNGTIVTKPTIPVSGTCPIIDPSVIIALLDNGTQVGSTPCASDGSFTLSMQVTTGEHTLVARVYTITGDAGQDSTPVHITTHIPPIIGGLSAGTSGGGDQPGEPALTLTIDEPFIIFSPIKDALWSGTITGGTLPYHVHIDWGDGHSNDYTIAHQGHQQFTHHYSSMTPHIIHFHLLDTDGRSISRTYAAVTPYVAPLGSIIVPTTPLPFQGSKPLGIYGAYLVLLAAFGYLWIHAGAFAYAKVTHKRKPRTSGHR